MVILLAGFMFLKSLMKGKEVAAGVWKVIIDGEERHILKMQLMESHQTRSVLVITC